MVILGSIIDWIFGQTLQDYPGVQVGANVHVSDLAYVYDIGLCINFSKKKMISALIPGEQRQVILLESELLEDVRRKRPGHRGDQISILPPPLLSFDAIVRLIVLYGCDTWVVQVTHERMLEVFDSDSFRRILRVKRRDCAIRGTAA